MICFRRRNCTVQDISFKRRFLNIYYDKKKEFINLAMSQKINIFNVIYIFFCKKFYKVKKSIF